MTVVFDTNVFLAAAFWKGKGRKCWAICARENIIIAVTDEILKEYELKAMELGKRYPRINPFPFLRWIENECPRFVPQFLGKQRSRDVTDDIFLAAVLASGATYLISRDQDLLSMGRPFGIKIISDDDFLKIVE